MGAAEFKAFERDGYSNVASGYASIATRVSSQAHAALFEVARIRSGSSLLDVACGPGALTSDALKQGAHVTAIDFAPGMVALAREANRPVQVMEADAEQLPFESGSFDAVLCNLGILHFPAPDRAAAEAQRVLNAGGVYAFTCWMPPVSNAFMALILGSIQKHGSLDVGLPDGPPLFRFGEASACTELLARAGFEDIETSEISIYWPATNPEAFVRDIPASTARLGALLERQTAAQRAAIEAAILSGARQFMTENGVKVPSKLMLASGRKTA
ncbi:MAG: class I SAM-dependent methyltransferase [Hyphomicrobiaceae bacterium]|nr:class I SAM-dependent methyltransferase [Hyphomicrobiaceae bacterium]